MKICRNLFGLGAVVMFAGLLLASGCSAPTISMSRIRSGEMKLTGVSKLAMIPFNTLPNDPFSGIAAADAGTVDEVQQAVKAALYQTKFFEVTDLGKERAIASVNPNAKPDARFDAFVSGRVWWTLAPEYRGAYPRKDTLETWENVSYTVRTKGFDGREVEVERIARLRTRMQDVLETQYYRERHATLMLSLSVYRLGGNGEIEKILDTLEVLHDAYVQDNGRTENSFVALGPRQWKADNVHKGEISADSKDGNPDGIELTAEVDGLPTEHQARMMAASKVAYDVVARMSPMRETIKVPGEFSDPKLTYLIDAQAYRAAKDYIVKTVRMTVGAELAERIDPLASYDVGDYEVPPSEKPEKYKDEEKFNDLLRDGNVHEYLYALGICEEATGRADQALYTYRYAFGIEPESHTALGISRCIDTLGNAARVKEQKKEADSASRKAKLD